MRVSTAKAPTLAAQVEAVMFHDNMPQMEEIVDGRGKKSTLVREVLSVRELDKQIDCTIRYLSFKFEANSQLAQLSIKTRSMGKQLARLCSKVTKSAYERLQSSLFNI